MKFTRVLALTIAVIMAAMCFASCGAPTLNINLKIDTRQGDVPVILDITVPVKSVDPTVLQVFEEGCILNEIAYTLTADETSVKDIGVYKDCIDTETNTTYFWNFTVNGEEVSGRAADIIVADGDTIQFTYTAIVPEE